MAITRDRVVELFEEHSEDIYDRFRLSALLYAALRKEGLISPAVEQELKLPVKTDHEKIEIILKNVQDKGATAFLKFCLVLAKKRIDMEHIVVDVLGLKLDDIRRQLDGLSVDSTAAPVPAPVPALVPAGSSQSASAPAATAAPAPGEEDPFILGGVQTVSAEEARSKLNDPGVYPLKCKPRGRAIIINIEKYDSASMNREGSNTDVVNLTMLFTKLGFQVDPWTNFNAKTIKAYIDRERLSPHHGDAFVLCVLSHGDRGRMQASDDQYLRIEEDLVKPFNGVNAPALVNRPKMFFIQACQGGDKTTGVRADGLLEDLMEELGQDDNDPPGPPQVTSHEMADILVVNSTVQGYSSFRDVEMGSFFMRDLVSVFSERCHKDHVEDMVTEVARRLNERRIGSGGLKQICNKESKLTKKMYFLPGYSES